MLNDKLALGVNNHTHPKIDETLYALSRQFGRTILLIDRFACDPFGSAIQTLKSALPKTLILIDPLFRDDPGMAPLLVELIHSEPSHHEFLRGSVIVAQEESKAIFGAHSICG